MIKYLSEIKQYNIKKRIYTELSIISIICKITIYDRWYENKSKKIIYFSELFWRILTIAI